VALNAAEALSNRPSPTLISNQWVSNQFRSHGTDHCLTDYFRGRAAAVLAKTLYKPNL
jgi:hypothetical protein